MQVCLGMIRRIKERLGTSIRGKEGIQTIREKNEETG